MKNMNRLYKVISAVITAGYIILGGTVFFGSYLRLEETLHSLWQALKYMCSTLAGSTAQTPQFGSAYIEEYFLPEKAAEFSGNVQEYFRLFLSGENFNMWADGMADIFLTGLITVLMAIPVLIALYHIVKGIYARPNNRHGKDSLQLRMFKKFSVAIHPIKRGTRGYFEYVSDNGKLKALWVTIWLLNLNAISVITAFLAYYMYFAVTLDSGQIYAGMRCLVGDICLGIGKIPLWIILTVGLLLFNKYRHKTGLDRLRHMEAKNCGFISELPIVTMTCGSMGKKKTTVITDMALSQEVMFRQKALEILQRTDMKFPHFPWISFEKELVKCMEYRTVYNLGAVKEWVNKKRKRYERHGDERLQLYGYDVKNYGMTYTNELKEESLFDALITYGQAYFVYIMQPSIILSNYAVRTDGDFFETGNFPVWINDFFPKGTPKDGRFSKILDFDILRLGKKVKEGNARAGSFEFGVVAITEVGKERGNNLELKDIKKNAEQTNQKNDLFNSWLKMCRHSATIDNFPFIKVFTDEQRPESWGADARDLCDILTVTECSEQKIALPGYIFEETISDILYAWFTRVYTEYRFLRGDNTLFMYLLKSVVSAIYRRNERIKNRYGYCTVRIEKERGTRDGKKEYKKYFLMNKKIYSRRFSTDCFSDYFNELAKKSKTGIMDYAEYMTEKASVEELKEQNSYFINELYKETDGNGSA